MTENPTPAAVAASPSRQVGVTIVAYQLRQAGVGVTTVLPRCQNWSRRGGEGGATLPAVQYEHEFRTTFSTASDIVPDWVVSDLTSRDWVVSALPSR